MKKIIILILGLIYFLKPINSMNRPFSNINPRLREAFNGLKKLQKDPPSKVILKPIQTKPQKKQTGSRRIIKNLNKKLPQKSNLNKRQDF